MLDNCRKEVEKRVIWDVLVRFFRDYGGLIYGKVG